MAYAQQQSLSPEHGSFLKGLARAFAGSLIFSLPIFMTMEMWWLGFYMDPLRLALLLALTVPLLIGLSLYGGFRKTANFQERLADALVALAVAAFTAALVLFLFGVVTAEMAAREIIGKIALQMVPGSIGAMLARSQLTGDGSEEDEEEEERKKNPSYFGELFLMAIGALFLSLNVAPTEEMVLIAYQMTVWQEIALVVLSLTLMHAFVYSIDFAGQEQAGEGHTFWAVFARFGVVGYAIVLLMSMYVLWTFGRMDGLSLQEILSTSIVLGFPSAVGAAAARLVL